MRHGTVEQISVDAWLGLLENSPQGTCFLDPEFLDLFDVPVRYWGLFRRGMVIAGLAVIEATNYAAGRLPWCYYQGIVFHREIWRAAPAKRTQYEIELSEDLVTAVAKVEPKFTLSLHPTLQDVRGLDWVHYHDAVRPRLRLLPRYTAVVDLESATRDSLRAASRSARRQEEGYASSREKLRASSNCSIDELCKLYRGTFDRQGIQVSKQEAELLPVFARFLLTNFGADVLAVCDESGTAMAAALVFKDMDGTTHVPVVGTGATRFGGTMDYFHILDCALEGGARAVDFDGANSPDRAYFKHSMGAVPMLNFEVVWDNSALLH